MDEEIKKELGKSLALINKVMDASMNDSNDIEGSLANYGAFIQIKLCVESHIELAEAIHNRAEAANG